LPAASQEAKNALTEEAYVMPPREIAEAVLAPWWKNSRPSSFSHDAGHYLDLGREGMPVLADLAKAHANLAGLDVDTVANRARTLTVRSSTRLRVVPAKGGEAISVAVPKDCKVSDARWSPDGATVAYFLHRPDRTEIWALDVKRKGSRRVTDRPVLATLNADFAWLDARTLVLTLIPSKRPQNAEFSAAASAPRVGVTEGKPYRLRTYASLLGGVDDATRFEYFTTGQLAAVGLDGKVSEIGTPQMVRSVNPSPDGKYLRVSVVERPFSYLFPYSSFGQREFILDRTGKELVQLSKRALSTGAVGEGNNDPRRNLEWRPDGKGLSYIRSGGGGRGAEGGRGERIVLWKAPFGNDDIETVWSSEERISSVRYSADGALLFVQVGGSAPGGGTQAGGRGRGAQGGGAASASKLLLVRPGGGEPVTLTTRSGNDEEEDGPGSLDTFTTPGGVTAARISSDGNFAYLRGTTRPEDPTKKAPRPWLDRVSLADGKRERVWESKEELYETADVLDSDLRSVLVTRQSAKDVPNSFLVDLTTKAELRLTDNRDYLPDLTQARRERIQITRNDGIKFWATVTYPRWYTFGKLPAFFWFYPCEYTDQAAYDRTLRSININDFREVSASNKAILIRRGYLLVEPDCPIVGPAEAKNDLYIPQLRNNLAATLDELDRRGIIDRHRLGLGGHSYGAFSTVNAMVHTPFFKAGIAGDGNYNRLLTPFGFQSDQRQLWNARETYLNVSPILYADQITGALLMYHGVEDQNMGTAPINSERMFATLQALGKPAALYMYPYEDHGQIAQETVLDQWARWVAWLDKYLK
jgi:dipeptidyl aminopeptidase/acylaminoacyl peptidase